MSYKVISIYDNYEEYSKIFNEDEYEKCKEYAVLMSRCKYMLRVEVIEFNDITDKILGYKNMK